MAPTPSIFIATPMYGGLCHGGYTWGMIQIHCTLIKKGWDAYFWYETGNSLVHYARNNLVHQFLTRAKHCTHLLFVDADVVGFNGDDVCSMVEQDVDIICGAYPIKQISWDSVKNACKEGATTQELSTAASPYALSWDGELGRETGKAVKIKAGATGFMLIKRQVFEKMASSTETFKSTSGEYSGEDVLSFFDTGIDPESRVFIGEDIKFCNDWTKLGGSVYLAPWVKLQHAGTHIFG